jgi:predicted alpha-1,2-mannosidase
MVVSIDNVVRDPGIDAKASGVTMRPTPNATDYGTTTGRARRRLAILALSFICVAATAFGATPAFATSGTPSPSPSSSLSPSPSARPATGTASGATHNQPATCSVASNGRLVNCPRPGTSAKQPAGVKNNATVGSSVGNLAQLVDTRTWTTGGGNTYPGATAPFGMVQWSPDTMPNRSAGGGYSFGDTKLTGYSLTHVSGPGCGAAGDVPILPMTGALPSGDPSNVQTAFTNTGEVAQAGYYSAQSNAPDTITSQFTATTHSSMGRFTFPSTTQADFLVKLMDSQNGDFGDSVHVVSNTEIAGSDTSGQFCGEANNDGQVQQYTVYFDIVFDQPFTASQVITQSGQSDPDALFLTFDTTSNPVVQAKVGISYVSADNAKLNWQTENPGWDFTSVQNAAQQDWNTMLGRVQVSGRSYALTQEFYSLLYKDFMQPNITSDVNDQYMGADNKVHTLGSGQADQYGIYSGWDTYHSLAQLQAILDPAAASDQAQSLLNYYSQDSILQQWGYLNLNNYVMVGDPAQSIIADDYAFGARNFDTGEALTDMLKQATTVNDVRPGEALEQQLGYLPEDGSYGCCNSHGQVSTLLEYDTEDLALSQFAAALGDKTDASMLEQRANNWQNVFNPGNDLLNPRNQNGSFVSGITPTSTDPYVEGDAYEYLWNVPNNYPALFSALGGKKKAAAMLRTFLSQPNGFGMFAQLSNEFGFGEQYAPNYAGDPAGTQKAVNTMLTTMYPPGPSGLPNNDDLGANSSTFIWEMLGMYPENSGTDTMVFNGAGFPQASISLPNGKTIRISAPGASDTTFYVKSLKLNGKTYNKLSVPFSTLAKGATLDWKLGSKPSNWGTATKDAPPSYGAGTRSTIGFLSSQQVTVAPGGSATVKIGAQNTTTKEQTVTAHVTSPAGLTVSLKSSRIEVPPNGSGTVTATVSAKTSTPQTFYTVPVSLSSGGQTLPGLTLTVLVAQPGSLLASFDNPGISDDSAVGAGNFDGGGFSYSAEALATAGATPGQPITSGGITYTWPVPTPGYPDNVIAAGQKITVNAPAGTQQVGFLGAATNGPSEGLTTLTYTDGSTAQYWLGLSDWTLNGGGAKPSYGNQVAATTSYRNCAGCSSGRDSVATDVFSTSLPVDPSKTLASVTLPTGATQGQLHLFAIGTSTTAMTGAVITSISPATADAGQVVTINGSGFGASQGSGYVAFSDLGTNWGAPGNSAPFTVNSWSDTTITFTVPTPSGSSGQFRVWPGTIASIMVVNSSASVSDIGALEITPSSSMSDYYDNTGISADSNQACANLDGVGFSLSADALAAAGVTPGGTVTSGGVIFTWPNVAVCQPDNVLAAGQQILLPPHAGAGNVGFLVTSTNGDSSGPVTITYTDGSTTTAMLDVSDWAGSAEGSEVVAASMPYRNATGGTSDQTGVSVYEISVPVDSAKTVASVTLPFVGSHVGSGQTGMHIFAIATG